MSKKKRCISVFIEQYGMTITLYIVNINLDYANIPIYQKIIDKRLFSMLYGKYKYVHHTALKTYCANDLRQHLNTD